MQGCSLDCTWCHSPHSQCVKSPLLYFDSLCLQCKRCVAACQNGVHSFVEGQHLLHREKCQCCGDCIDACPQSSFFNQSGPLCLPTRYAEVQPLFEMIRPQLDLLKGRGGITFSGGEPLLQSEALSELARLCKESGFHTAVETSGIVTLEALKRMHPYIDTWLIGLRLLTSDDTSNRKYLEKQTRQTMDFLKQSDVTVRIPVIPGYTTTDDYLTQVSQILIDYELNQVDILPLNPETSHYYDALGVDSNIEYDATQANQLYQYVSNFLEMKQLNKNV